MAQPANTTGWDSSNTNVVVPSGTKKALGWVVNEKPASGYFNWLLVTIEAWLVWLQGIYGYAASWSQLQTFLAGVAINSPLQLGNVQLTGASNPNQIGNTPDPVYVAIGTVATTYTLPAAAPVGTTITFCNAITGGPNLTVAAGVNTIQSAAGTTVVTNASLRLTQISAGVWQQA